jgi:hypothetical protein
VQYIPALYYFPPETTDAKTKKLQQARPVLNASHQIQRYSGNVLARPELVLGHRLLGLSLSVPVVLLSFPGESMHSIAWKRVTRSVLAISMSYPLTVDENVSFFFSFLGWGESTCYIGHYWPIVPAPDDDDDDECGAFGGMRIGRRHRSTWRKSVPVPHCPPQIPHYLTWTRTWAAAVGSQRLTA